MRAVTLRCVLAIATAPAFSWASARANEVLPTGASYSRAMLERPLFSSTRRPLPPSQPLVARAIEAVPPQAAPPNVTLSGIILGSGQGIVLLHRPQDQSAVRIALGGQVDGWTVAEIHPRALVLRQGLRSVIIELPTPTR